MNCIISTSAIIALMMKIRRTKVLMKGLFIIFLLGQFFGPLSSFAATDCSTVTVIPQTECECLLDIYNSTDGPNWANSATNKWNTDQDPSGWEGVTVEDGYVIKLNLESNQLNGPIPDSLGSLTNLSFLNLNTNQLSGPIPDSLASLTNLSSLDLSVNQLSGMIPDSLGSLTNLYDLVLGYNQLTGPIPESLGNLTKLFYLYLQYNQLTGPIPDSLSSLTNLFGFGLGNNQLSGPIPDLSQMTSLEGLYLDYNQLSGPIPDSLGSLTNLSHLYLNSNQLSGSIPDSLGSLTNLSILDLNNNQLSGPIPGSLGSLTNLEALSLSSNQLSGTIPDLSQLTKLEAILLESNQLSGLMPDSLGSLTNLSHLNLNNNQLSGPIPDSLSSLTKLSHLNLNSNQLSGTIPESLGSLTNLFDLNLGNNQLSGTIPDLSQLTALGYLDLSGNQLSGDIPSSFSSLPGLWDLNLGYNQLSASDPGVTSFLEEKDYDWEDTQASKHITGTVKLGDTGISGVGVTASNWDIPNGFTSATTDENGKFDILVSGGRWEINVPQSSNVSWVSPAETQTAEFADDNSKETQDKTIILQAAAGKLTGRLLDPDGNLLAVTDDCNCDCNCAVWIDVVDPDTGYYLCVNPDAETRFSFPLPAGDYEISVWLDGTQYPGYASPVLGPVSFSADNDLGDILLKNKTAASAQGTVLLNDTGTPAVSAEVFLYNYYYDFIRTVFTGEDGTFIFENLEAGDYNIEIEPPFGNNAVRGISFPFFIETDNVDLGDNTLPGNSEQIQGTVRRDDNDAPVPNVTVTAYNWDMYEFRETVTDETGSFSIQAGDGLWEIEVLQNDEADWTSPGEPYEIEFNGEATEPLDIRLKTAAGKLTGRVVDAEGNPFNDSSYDFISVDAYDFESGDYRYVWPDKDGSFSLPLPLGNYEVVIWTSPEPAMDSETAAFPRYYTDNNASPIPQIISFSGDTGLGDIWLVKRSKIISGSVKDSRDEGMSGVFMDIWRPATGAYYWTETDASGNYTIKVPSGVWEVSPYVIEDSDNLLTEPPREVVFSETDEEEVTVSFQLEKIATMIVGTVKDENGKLLTDLDAWVYARPADSPESVSETWVENGEFRLGVPGGKLRIGLYLPAESEYILLEEESFPSRRMTPCEERTTAEAAMAEMYPYEKQPQKQERQEGLPITDLSFTLKKNDTMVTGFLKDADDKPVTNISGYVFVTPSGGGSSMYSGDVDPYTGGFEILVSEGTWNLSYYLDTDEYMSHPPVSWEITVGPGGITEDIPLILLDGVITGSVKNTEGELIPNIQVWARSQEGSMFEARTFTDQEGRFSFSVPGQEIIIVGTDVSNSQAEETFRKKRRRYRNSGRRSSSGGKKRDSSSLTAICRVSGRGEDMILTLRSPDTILEGTATLNGKAEEGVFVSAYTQDGQKAQAYTDENGSFQLDVARADEGENNIWKVTAVRRPVGESSYYRSDEVHVEISGTAGTANAPATVSVQELVLKDTGISLPDPETGNFKVEKGWTHTLADGTQIQIPGNAIPTNEKEANVLVEARVEGVPDNAEDIVVGYGYAISVYEKKSRKEIVTLNRGKEMVISFRCTEARLSEVSADVQDIRPASFMDASEAWQPVKSFTLKEETESKTLRIDFKADHFGVWSLVAARSLVAAVDVKDGDVNNSGTVGLDDAIQALKVCTQSPATAFKEADVSGDGRIGLEEVIYILRTLAK